MTVRRRLITTGVLFAMLLVSGTAGYMLIEGWSFLDALYQTVTTVSTVGFREVHDLSTAGRVFTIVLILGGVGGVFYTLTTAVTLAVEGELAAYFGRRRMESRIASMRSHYLLCGFGRVGREIAREFVARHVPFVVIDPNPEVREDLQSSGYTYIADDATDDAVLRHAGVRVAAALIAAVDSDTANTYIVLSARALNPSIFIVARASEPGSESKMRRAGADRVISPYSIAGQHMAVTALQPAMTDFMTTSITGREGEMLLAEMTVTPASGMAERPVHEVFGRNRSVTVLAIRRDSGDLITAPSPDEILKPHDQVIALGPPEALESFATRTGASVPTSGHRVRVVGPRLSRLIRRNEAEDGTPSGG